MQSSTPQMTEGSLKQENQTQQLTQDRRSLLQLQHMLRNHQSQQWGGEQEERTVRRAEPRANGDRKRPDTIKQKTDRSGPRIRQTSEKQKETLLLKRLCANLTRDIALKHRLETLYFRLG